MFQAARDQASYRQCAPQMKAKILVGINCGFGNADSGSLMLKSLDFDGGIVKHSRTKTGYHAPLPALEEDRRGDQSGHQGTS
jgi:hypothetical protein